MSVLHATAARRAPFFFLGIVAFTLLCPLTIAQTQHHIRYEPNVPAPVRPKTLSPEELERQTGVHIKPEIPEARARKHAALRPELKQKLAEMKRRSTALVALANSLDNELANTREDVLPITVVQRAEKIEKLAKEIKNWGKGLY